MLDPRSHVRTSTQDPEKMEIIIQGESCSTFNILSRAEAFALARQIIEHLRGAGRP